MFFSVADVPATVFISHLIQMELSDRVMWPRSYSILLIPWSQPIDFALHWYAP